jgi:Holliday junction resolvasome RuvABC DNA-binding subunit
MALGYSQNEAAAAAEGVSADGTQSLEEKIRAALQAFARR